MSSRLPLDALTHILSYVGDPTEVSQVSKSWLQVAAWLPGWTFIIRDTYQVTARSVQIQGASNLTDNDLKEEVLREVPRIQFPQDSPVTEVTFSRMAGWVVSDLNLWFCEWVNDSMVKHLSGCCSLRSINLQGCSITDESLQVLSTCSSLESVDLTAQGHFTDTSVQILSRSSSLQSIILAAWKQLTEASAQALSTCSSLRSIDLRLCHVTDDWVKYLVQCPSLEAVNFSRCSELTDESARILSTCPSLHTVNFFGCQKLTDDGVRSLSESKSVRTVVLSFCVLLTDASAQALAGCPSLQSVDFTGCKQLTNASVAFLADCPSVRFSRCPRVTDWEVLDW